MYTTIKKASDYFNTKLYTGDGTSSRNITGIGFQPDLVWIKDRSAAENNNVTDAVRGATKTLETNTTNAEGTYSTVVPAFLSDGFTIGSSAYVNTNNDNYVSWNWLGGNGTVSNTDGSITSTVSANTTSGFSIVSYTGTGSASDTVGHGLGVSPSCIIIKDRNSTAGTKAWYVMHKGLTSGKNIRLNSTDIEYDHTLSGFAQGIINTSPSSTTFGFVAGASGNDNVVKSSTDYIAYCFAEKKGFSKFGKYTGNGNNSNGTFVYTGFKPAWVMIKRTDTAGAYWTVMDSVRSPYNEISRQLYPSISDAEYDNATNNADFLSNGFKLYHGSAPSPDNTNASGGTYIYMAFAEEPLVGDNPATAR